MSAHHESGLTDAAVRPKGDRNFSTSSSAPTSDFDELQYNMLRHAGPMNPGQALAVQRLAGNDAACHAVQRQPAGVTVQREEDFGGGEIGGEMDEEMPEVQTLREGPAIQRMADGCHDGDGHDHGGGDHPVLQTLASGGGSAMSSDARATLEPKLGDLGSVQMKVDPAACESVGAQAFTANNTIVSREPLDWSNPSHKQTISHEAKHAADQAAGSVPASDTGQGFAMSSVGDAGEVAAENFAAEVMAEQSSPQLVG